jgi:hypothetical protein
MSGGLPVSSLFPKFESDVIVEETAPLAKVANSANPESNLAALAGLAGGRLQNITVEETCRRIGVVAEELNSLGPWPSGLRGIICPTTQVRIREADRLVDDAAEMRVGELLTIALIEYRQAWLMALAEANSIISSKVTSNRAGEEE